MTRAWTEAGARRRVGRSVGHIRGDGLDVDVLRRRPRRKSPAGCNEASPILRFAAQGGRLPGTVVTSRAASNCSPCTVLVNQT